MKLNQPVKVKDERDASVHSGGRQGFAGGSGGVRGMCRIYAGTRREAYG